MKSSMAIFVGMPHWSRGASGQVDQIHHSPTVSENSCELSTGEIHLWITTWVGVETDPYDSICPIDGSQIGN